MDTLQGKKIAEFMGYFVQCRNATTYWVRNPNLGGEFKRLSTLKYHSSFDALAPVLDKIEKLGFTIRYESRKDGLHWMWIWGKEDDNPIVAECSISRFLVFCNSVAAFVNFYSQKNEM